MSVLESILNFYNVWEPSRRLQQLEKAKLYNGPNVTYRLVSGSLCQGLSNSPIFENTEQVFIEKYLKLEVPNVFLLFHECNRLSLHAVGPPLFRNITHIDPLQNVYCIYRHFSLSNWEKYCQSSRSQYFPHEIYFFTNFREWGFLLMWCPCHHVLLPVMSISIKKLVWLRSLLQERSRRTVNGTRNGTLYKEWHLESQHWFEPLRGF